MNYTAQDAINGLNVTYPQVSAADALKYYKEVLYEILTLADVEKDSQDENLTDGTREYELSYNPILTQIDAVYYITSATAATKLKATSEEILDRTVDQWRYTTNTGTPTHYYIKNPDSAALATEGKIVIGLEPIPDTTTSAGYPIVRIFGTEFEEPSATSDIPSAIQSVRVFIEGMKRLYAADRDPEMFPAWDAIYRQELHKTLSRINDQPGELDSPRLMPKWMVSRRIP